MPKHGSIILYVHGNQKAHYGRTAQDGHLDSHTAPELCGGDSVAIGIYPPSSPTSIPLLPSPRP